MPLEFQFKESEVWDPTNALNESSTCFLGRVIEVDEDKKAEISKLVKYLMETIQSHDNYAAKYLLCELVSCPSFLSLGVNRILR